MSIVSVRMPMRSDTCESNVHVMLCVNVATGNSTSMTKLGIASPDCHAPQTHKPGEMSRIGKHVPFGCLCEVSVLFSCGLLGLPDGHACLPIAAAFLPIETLSTVELSL